jgi:tetratricopeptide (TPR) repeat protein
MRFICSLLLVGALLIGCGQYENPNDLTSVAPIERAKVAFNLMQNVVGKLEEKFQKSEITNVQRDEYIAKFAEEVMPSIDAEKIPPTDYWMYADLLRTTKRWSEAEAAYEKAVKFASTTDRKVNDTLRLSQAKASLGKVDDAIRTARAVYQVKDEECAPILPATLYEIVPAAEGKGKDVQLAQLLEDAIACHERVKVDRGTDGGKLFVAARAYHISKAEAKMRILRASAGEKPDTKRI